MFDAHSNEMRPNGIFQFVVSHDILLLPLQFHLIESHVASNKSKIVHKNEYSFPECHLLIFSLKRRRCLLDEHSCDRIGFDVALRVFCAWKPIETSKRLVEFLNFLNAEWWMHGSFSMQTVRHNGMKTGNYGVFFIFRQFHFVKDSFWMHAEFVVIIPLSSRAFRVLLKELWTISVIEH